MSYWQTASLVETGHRSGGANNADHKPKDTGLLLRCLFDALVGLVHVFDVSLEKKQVGLRLAVNL
jgi:hypothetical protein